LAGRIAYYQGIVDHHSLAVQPLDWEVCIAAADLPPVHKDLCDRFIIATAKMQRLTVVTGDAIFGAYGIDIVS